MHRLLVTLSVLGGLLAVSPHGAIAASVPLVSPGSTPPRGALHNAQYWYGYNAPYAHRYYYNTPYSYDPYWRAQEWRREQYWRWRRHEYWRHRRWRCWNFGECY